MKTIDSIKNCFTNLGFNSAKSTRKDLLKIQNILSMQLISIDIILICVYVYYEANNFEEYVDAIFLLSTSSIAFFAFLSLLWQMPELYRFVNNLEITITKRFSHPASKRIYEKLDYKLQKCFNILECALAKVLPIVAIMLKFITCFTMYCTSDLGIDSFELPMQGRWFPFNWKNPSGYMIACLIEYILELNMSIGTLYVTILEAGSVFILILMAKDVRRSLILLNKKVKAKAKLDIVQQFTEIIQLQNDAKQLTKDFSEPLKPMFTAIFSYSILSICAALLSIQMELNSNYPITAICYRFMQVFMSLGTISFYCELGHRVSNAFEEINRSLDRMKWYLFPVKIRQMLPIVMVAAQEPITLGVFGSTSCSRVDLKMVTNKAYSYFMMIQQIGLR